MGIHRTKGPLPGSDMSHEMGETVARASVVRNGFLLLLISGRRFHDLRHMCATRLIQAGVDVYTVQKLGRWKTISMVLR